jgi:hypothetical protein
MSETAPQHTYPSNYRPSGKDTDLDRVWEGLDFVRVGVIPDDVRAYLAGYFGGLISRTREEERAKR